MEHPDYRPLRPFLEVPAREDGELTARLLKCAPTKKPEPGQAHETDRESPPLRIEVVDGNGDPVPRAHIRLKIVEEDAVWCQSWGEVRDGKAKVSYPKAARSIQLEVFDARTSAGEALPLGAVRTDTFPAGIAELAIAMPPERSISGVVRDSDGIGMSGLILRAEPHEPSALQSWGEPHRIVRTAEDGTFHLGGLWKGSYIVKLDSPDGWLGAWKPDPVESGTTDLVFELDQGEILDLTVLDPTGEPLPGAKVELGTYGGGTRWMGMFTGYTDANGRLRLTGLIPEEPHTAHVSPPEHRDDLLRLTARDLRAGTKTIRMKRAHWLAIVVDDPASKGLIVWARSDFRWERAATLGGGRFRGGPFAAGTVKLLALPQKAPAEEWEHRAVEVPAGSERVTLTPMRPVDLTIRVAEWPADAGKVEGCLRIDGTSFTRWTKATPGGVFTFEALPPHKTFSFLARPIHGRYYARRIDIQIGREEVEAELTPGGSIAGRVIAPPGVNVFDVTAEGDRFRLWLAASAADGAFEFRAVPEGSYRLSVAGFDGAEKRSYRGRAEARPGESVTIRLE